MALRLDGIKRRVLRRDNSKKIRSEERAEDPYPNRQTPDSGEHVRNDLVRRFPNGAAIQPRFSFERSPSNDNRRPATNPEEYPVRPRRPRASPKPKRRSAWRKQDVVRGIHGVVALVVMFFSSVLLLVGQLGEVIRDMHHEIELLRHRQAVARGAARLRERRSDAHPP